MIETGTPFYLRDDKTGAAIQSVKQRENGDVVVSYNVGEAAGYMIYSPGETIAIADGPDFVVPPEPAREPEPQLTVTISATDIMEAYKEGFKMALGMNMLMAQFGLDAEKITKAVENVGQIAVQAQVALENIQKQNAEILAKLEKLEKAQDGKRIGEPDAATVGG